MKLPEDREVILCPRCKSKCQFDRLRPGSIPSYRIQEPGGLDYVSHDITISYCIVCGGPVIEWQRKSYKGAETTSSEQVIGEPIPDTTESVIVFPIASPREKAHEIVRRQHPDLADDYDEAVACEPSSLQASVFLLGRCISQILIMHCGVTKALTLGPQIDEAIAANKVPQEIADELKGPKSARDQAGHPWFDTSGEIMKVQEDQAEWAFAIVDLMFEHYYIAPERKRQRLAKLGKDIAEKKAGEKS